MSLINCAYSYNRFGLDPNGGFAGQTFLGLGSIDYHGMTRIPAISESQVRAPSEMFAISDSRVARPFANGSFGGSDFMVCGFPQRPQDEIQTPRHGSGYNVVACDGHVVLVKRDVLLDPSKSGQNWNNDNEPHREFWSELFCY